VAALLAAGAPVDARDDQGVTLLMRCAERGYGTQATPAILAALLDAGAKIADTDDDGNTALHLAVMANQLPAVSFLLAHGADANTPNLAGMRPLDLAGEWNNALISQLIAAGAERSPPPAPAAPPAP
jgi:uncharacterized protein